MFFYRYNGGVEFTNLGKLTLIVSLELFIFIFSIDPFGKEWTSSFPYLFSHYLMFLTKNLFSIMYIILLIIFIYIYILVI